MTITIGARIGLRHESSAICGAETEERTIDRCKEDHLLVRHLERIPSGASYLRLARRVGTVTGEVYWRAQNPPEVLIDATGLGPPVFDLVEQEALHGWMLAVQEDPPRWSLTSIRT